MNGLIDTRFCKIQDAIGELTDIFYNYFNPSSESHIELILSQPGLKKHIRAGKQNYVKKILEKELNPVEKRHIRNLLETQLQPYLGHLKPSLYVVLEAPYIDRMYRDAYYSYYSTKLKIYNRDTCRLSFFDKPIQINDFRDFECSENNPLSRNYMGYMVIRPTLHRIVGRSLISPKALKKDKIECCQATFTATANSVKFDVSGFPYSAQDGQTITCAETTIWSLMEYFGNKFPHYKTVLPSTIHEIVQKIITKRSIPSDGLSLPQMSYIIRALGFGNMTYSKSNYAPEKFYSIISMYIESGIPVIGIFRDRSRKLGHAVNIIGREKDDLKKIAKSKKFVDQKNRGKVIDYHDFQKRFVIIDDNYPPYQLASLNGKYVEYDSKRTSYELTDIIVPLYSKIYLEAIMAKQNIELILQSRSIGIADGERRIIKTFLASTRSYKQYLALNSTMDIYLKELLLMIPMARFIWVTEISTIEGFKENLCVGLVILDSTEPVQFEQDAVENFVEKEDLTAINPVTVIYNNGLFYWRNLLNFEKERIFAQNLVPPFSAFNDNLKSGYK